MDRPTPIHRGAGSAASPANEIGDNHGHVSNFLENDLTLWNGRMEEWKDGRMEGWKNGRMEEWKDGRMEEWKNGRMEEWKDGRMEEWKNGRMEEWKDGRNGRMEEKEGRDRPFPSLPSPPSFLPTPKRVKLSEAKSPIKDRRRFLKHALLSIIEDFLPGNRR